MRKEKEFKTFAIIAIFIAIIGLSIGYANLSETLRINSKTTLEGSTWKIEFENVGTPTLNGTAAIVTPASLTATIISLDVSLTKPGDSIIYTFDVTNKGDIDAKLSAIPTITGLDEATANNINYTLTYANGGALTANDELNAGDTKNLKLTIVFNSTATTVVATDTILNINASLVYVQK